MAYRFTSRFGALLLALAGCGSVTGDDTTTTDPSDPSQDPASDPATPEPGNPEPGTPFRFYTSDAGGSARGAFDALDDAFLAANGALDVAPGDYYFSIGYDLCRPGFAPEPYRPQQAPIMCRAFRVGATGEIVAGASLADCSHSITATPSSGLAIGLYPFEVHPAACGSFTVRVIPMELLELDANARANLVFSAPVPAQPAPDPEPEPGCGEPL